MTNKKVVLYDLATEMNALDELLKMDGGEITKEREELEKELLETISLKVDAYIGYTSNLEDEILAAEKRVAQLKVFISVRENAITRIKAYALRALENAKVMKFKGQFGEISTRKPTKVLKINDEKNIPINFLITKRETKIDGKGLKSYLISGKKVEGCEIVDGKKSISFKVKALKNK